ncbi:MAG: hypothetical protein QOH36_1090 [Actinomycetota bacterium]|nr:hypothetical protein [Actinomycetota bacterium]MEA2972664.1 hypothetical protein [Actinomycetota bacterium]
MPDQLLRAYVWTRCLLLTTTSTLTHRDERGEGVVSSAIAVLIFAALGALMWVGFRSIWGNASSQTSTQIDSIGR